MNLIQELEVYQVELELQNEELRRMQKELEVSRNKFYDLYDLAPVGFLSLNAHGDIVRVNRAAEEMLAVPGKMLGKLPIYPQDYSLFNSCLKKAAGFGGRQACEANLHMLIPIDKAEEPATPAKTPERLPGEPAAGPVPAGPKIRVLLADDHIVMRQGLTSMLERHADIDVAGEATDGEEAVQKARDLHPDVILMDISMPKMSGTEATKTIHAEAPGIRIIGLSMYDDPDVEQDMLDAGAVALVSKSGHTEALLAAIRGNSSPRKSAE